MAQTSTGFITHLNIVDRQHMWSSKKDKVWIQYRDNIIAQDVGTGIFLSTYLRQLNLQKAYVHYYEVIDLQHYKHISKPHKVRAAMNMHKNTPFIFPICIN
ncbi:MAG: hypothetical protein R2800_12595 [Flavipsychrobacter sp.]